MTTPEPDSLAEAGNPRVAADAGAAADLATRLTEATAGLAAVRAELAAVLLDIDAAVGAGDSARAFREGFSPVGAVVAEFLRDTETRFDEHRRDLVAGVDALVGTDVEMSAHIGRADAR